MGQWGKTRATFLKEWTSVIIWIIHTGRLKTHTHTNTEVFTHSKIPMWPRNSNKSSRECPSYYYWRLRDGGFAHSRTQIRQRSRDAMTRRDAGWCFASLLIWISTICGETFACLTKSVSLSLYISLLQNKQHQLTDIWTHEPKPEIWVSFFNFIKNQIQKFE